MRASVALALVASLVGCQQTLTLKGHSEAVNGVAFSPDGKQIVSGSDDNTVRVWDATTGQQSLTLKANSRYVSSVAFSPDGKWIASGGGNEGSLGGTVRVWDAASGQEILTLKRPAVAVTMVAFSPDGKRLASGSYDKNGQSVGRGERQGDAHLRQRVRHRGVQPRRQADCYRKQR